MTCGKVRKWVGALLDGEIAETLRNRIHEHLTRCESCRKFFEEIKKIKESLSRLRPKSAPPGLKESILQRLQNAPDSGLTDRPSFSLLRRPWASLASAAVVLLLIGAASLHFMTGRSTADIVTATSDCHSRCLKEGEEPLNFTSEKCAEIRDWLSDRLNLPLSLPDRNKLKNCQVFGSSVCTIMKARSGIAAYSMNGSRVSLFITEMSPGKFRKSLKNAASISYEGRQYFKGEKGNFRIVVWQNGKIVYTAVSDLGEEDLCRFLSLIPGA